MLRVQKVKVDDIYVPTARSPAPILLATPKPVITPIMAVNPQLAKMLFRLSPQERRKIRTTAHYHIRAAVLQLHAVSKASRR